MTLAPGEDRPPPEDPLARPQNVWLRRLLFRVHALEGDRFLTLLLDPVTAEMLGELPERSLVRSIQDLHFDLLAGRTGRAFNGVGALLLLVLCATGLVIWWPGRREWHRALTVDPRRPWRRVTWELHRALGFWTFLLIVMWAVTGLAFTFPSSFRAVVDWLSPLTTAQRPTSNSSAGEPLGPSAWSDLVKTAQEEASGWYVARVVLPATDTATVSVLFAQERPTPVGADLRAVYLDQYTGQVLPGATVPDPTAGDQIMAWVAPLHMGSFGGVGVKIAWLVLGLAPAVLFVTGFLIRWSRVVRPRRRHVAAGARR